MNDDCWLVVRTKRQYWRGVKQRVFRPWDFGFSKHFGSKYELGEEVGRGHFGYTCSTKFKKGELKGQQVAVKVIPKAKEMRGPLGAVIGRYPSSDGSTQLGGIIRHNKKCRDVAFLVIFIAFWVAMIVNSSFGFNQGNPKSRKFPDLLGVSSSPVRRVLLGVNPLAFSVSVSFPADPVGSPPPAPVVLAEIFWRTKTGKFKHHGLENTVELQQMFDRIVVTGEIAWTPTAGPIPPVQQNVGFEDAIDLEEGSGDSDEVNVIPTQIGGSSEKRKKNTIGPSLTGKGKKVKLKGPILLLFFLPAAAGKEPKQAAGTNLEKPNFGSALLCSSPSGCSCFVVREFLPCTAAGFFPLLGSVLAGKFWFPIVLLVSTEIECSVLCE
ncbi:hypothetical protein SLEP1_g52364 [Rubroshorea leprosula]|uniref:Uncharacterized protein n=1 Tax=Rubroshorea leprosula TaxID=152421 RepID=A0AAV5M6T5_9ROSI|nr:hypothetical protein SLEP1_g52364 [Rubroshorea leprosula]